MTDVEVERNFRGFPSTHEMTKSIATAVRRHGPHGGKTKLLNQCDKEEPIGSNIQHVSSEKDSTFKSVNATFAELIESTPKETPPRFHSILEQPRYSNVSAVSTGLSFPSNLSSLEWSGGVSTGPLFPDSKLKWIKLKFRSNGPKPRSNHVAAFINHKMIVFVGYSEDETDGHIHLIDTS